MLSLEKLFKGLATIVLSVFLFAAIGYGGSYLVKPQWESEVEIDVPMTAGLGNYYTLFSMYQLVSGEKSDINAADVVYQELKRQLYAEDSLSRFWKNTEYYKQKMTGEQKEDTLLLNELIKKITISESTLGRIKVKLASENAKQAADFLTAFLEQVNLATRDVVYAELIVKWKNLFNQVNTAIQLNVPSIYPLQTNTGMDWQSKLNMMKSVSALDNNLTSFRFAKNLTHAVESSIPNRGYLAACGGGVGLLIGLLISLYLRPTRRQEV